MILLITQYQLTFCCCRSLLLFASCRARAVTLLEWHLCTRYGCVLSHWCQRGGTMMPPTCLGVTQDCAGSPPGGLVLRAGLTLKVGSCHSQPCWDQCYCSEEEWGTCLLHFGQARSSPPLLLGLSLVDISEGELAPCVSNLAYRVSFNSSILCYLSVKLLPQCFLKSSFQI